MIVNCLVICDLWFYYLNIFFNYHILKVLYENIKLSKQFEYKLIFHIVIFLEIKIE